MKQVKSIIVAAALLGGLVYSVYSGAITLPGLGAEAGPGGATQTPQVPKNAAKAATQLDQLATQPRRTGDTGYEREKFGESWADIDGNGCDPRDDVLYRDAVDGTADVGSYEDCDHDVLAGTWNDPYTGKELRFTDLKDPEQANAIQVDHIVPLGEVWRSGGSEWTAKRRERYANTLANLVAADGPTNMSKSDDDPAAWKPDKPYRCSYARHWIAIKAEWELAVDNPERKALKAMLARCDTVG